MVHHEWQIDYSVTVTVTNNNKSSDHHKAYSFRKSINLVNKKRKQGCFIEFLLVVQKVHSGETLYAN